MIDLRHSDGYLKEEEFIDEIKTEVIRNGSQKNLAEEIGISEQFLSDIIHHKRKPGKKVLEYFGVKREILYIPADP